jgi:hypothetical protein
MDEEQGVNDNDSGTMIEGQRMRDKGLATTIQEQGLMGKG